MAEILYPSTTRFPGPWLIDSSRLEELDQLTDVAWKRMTDVRERRIQEAIDKRLINVLEKDKERERNRIEPLVRDSYDFKQQKRALKVDLRSGKQLRAQSFKEAALEKLVQDELPVSFKLELECASMQVSLELGNKYDKDLSFTVSPANDPVSKQTSYDFEKWIKSASPPGWVKMWRKIGPWIWYAFLLLLMVSLLLINTDSEAYKKELKSEAREMLKSGITTDAQRLRALQILLSLESDYVPDGFSRRGSGSLTSFWAIVSIGLFISLTVSFPPRNYLALGKGETSIRRWRWWIRFISITIPSTLLIPLFLDKLKSILF